MSPGGIVEAIVAEGSPAVTLERVDDPTALDDLDVLRLCRSADLD